MTKFIFRILFLTCGVFFSVATQAHGWNWGVGISSGFYGGGYGPWPYYGPGYGWGGPGVVVTVPVAPAPRYYVRECETVQICNQYDECWLERECN